MGSQVGSLIIYIAEYDVVMWLTSALSSTHHNVFERHHRFIGWLGLAVRTITAALYLSTLTYIRIDDLGFRNLGKQLRYQARRVENRCQYAPQCTGIMVCGVYDHIVSLPFLAIGCDTYKYRQRSDPLVHASRSSGASRDCRFPFYVGVTFAANILPSAISSSCNSSFRPRNAARSSWENQPDLCYGVSCFWNY